MKKLLAALLAMLLALPAISQTTSYDRPIHDAARIGNGEAVRKLLQADPKQRERELEAELSELTSSFLTAEAFSVEDNHRPA